MQDLGTIVYRNNEAHRLFAQFNCATSVYVSALKTGQCLGTSFEALVGAAIEHCLFYGDKSGAVRLEADLNRACRQVPVTSAWDGRDVGEDEIASSMVRADEVPIRKEVG